MSDEKVIVYKVIIVTTQLNNNICLWNIFVTVNVASFVEARRTNFIIASQLPTHIR